ncbi:MAG: hypothetical protein E7496_07610 [Ruminococcus sp.]|nr:hypothetical protein [Ruminococcus sp.]
MKQKSLWILPVLGTAVICTTACGRNDRNDRAVTDIPRTTTVLTDRPNHNGVGRTVETVVSDIVDDGADIVSDVVQGGRDIASDINQAADDAVPGTDILNGTDANDNYRVGSDGRTDNQAR